MVTLQRPVYDGQCPLLFKILVHILFSLHRRDILISYLLGYKKWAAFVFFTLRNIAIKCKTVVASFFPDSPINILCCQWSGQCHSKCTKKNGRFYKNNLHIARVGS